MKVVERAYAKINLGLKVLGRRPDGYHEVLTVMQTVDLYDEVTLEEAEGISLTCSDPDLPEGPENIAHRAAEGFLRTFGIPEGVRIHLTKRIPAGAGFGGGSSDAAAVLRGLCRLYGVRPKPGELEALASSLGSDVPFLLRPGTAVARGRGEILRYIAWPFDVFYVLVHPGFGISTKWAYEEADKILLTSGDEYFNLVSLLENGAPPRNPWGMLENDFSSLVEREHPQVRRLLRRLEEEGAFVALLSGSGSGTFGVFSEPRRAREVAEGLREEGLWAVACGPVAARSSNWQDSGLWSRLSRFESSPGSQPSKERG